MNLKVACNLLGLFGITANTAVSGEETIERMHDKPYHIVLLDHMMPKMDGIETLHRLKAQGLSHSVMIALTANAVLGAREMYLREGFADYLSKPIELPQLEAMLLRYLPESLVQKEAAPEILEFAPEEDGRS